MALPISSCSSHPASPTAQLDLFDLLQIPKPPSTAAASLGAREILPAARLASAIAERTNGVEALSSEELFALASDFFGGTLAAGAFSARDAYDAAELGLHLALLRRDLAGVVMDGGMGEALEGVAEAKRLATLLPSQTRRSQEQQAFQQFSTPASYAFACAWAAALEPGDVVLEPSAGTGALVAWPLAAGLRCFANELAERRADLLRVLLETVGQDPEGALFRENAEHLHAVLPAHVRPSIVLMNPPDTAGEVYLGPPEPRAVRPATPTRLRSPMLRPQTPGPVPADTARAARAAFPKGSPLVTLRDELGTVFADDDFAALYPDLGQPAYPPWRLALVTVLQFREDLSDRKAADAVRSRIDWKYLLGLPLDDPGFDASVLSEFRARLVEGGAEQVLLDRVLDACRDRGLLKKRGRQRTDATHVVANVREMNRLELVSETVRAALNALAAEAPGWVRALAEPAWFDRYGRRVEDARLPQGKAGRAARTAEVGADGYALLDAVDSHDAPPGLAALPAIDALRRVWGRHYERDVGDRPRSGTARPRELRGRGAEKGDSVESPYDPDARYRKKRATTWTGYAVHLSETCDEGFPRLVVHADTTPGDVHEAMRTGPILAALDARGLSASEHLADAGYVSGEHFVAAKLKHGVRLVGPARKNVRWQGEVEEHLLGTALDEAREAMRAELATDEGWAAYAARAGVEGTISQGVRAMGLRRTRYRGLAKTRLGHVATAAALSVDRAAAWLDGRPVAQTRTSRFAALAA
jgi:transposase